MKIITIAQQKGGAGKSTFAANIGISLVQSGRRVCLVDIDPQGTLTYWHNIREKKYGKGFTGVTFLTGAGWRLSNVISESKDNFDYLIIDSPPHIETESKSAIRAADLVLIPMQPSPADLWATKTTLEFAKNEKKLAKIVLNRYNSSSKIAKEIVQNLGDTLSNYLGNRVIFSSCFIQGASVTELDPASQASYEVKNLINEILLLTENSALQELEPVAIV
jgi:chromosome partitioning protein